MIRDCRLAIRGTWRRVENFEGRDRQRPNEISVFRDGVWSHWIPQRQGPGVTQRQAHRVVTEEAPSTLGLEVALGLSCPPMARIPVEPTSQALAVTWAEILTPYDAAGARVTDTQRGRLIDMPHRKFKTLRLQVEMGKEPPFPLLAVKVFTEINPGTWLLARHVEWSKHIEANGIPMAQEMWWANRRQVLVADDGPVDSWKLGQYEDTVYTERLTELEVDPDLPDSVFALPAPEPGTQVYDRVRGETYVIGSAGEILERTAIAARGLQSSRVTPWWLLPPVLGTCPQSGARPPVVTAPKHQQLVELQVTKRDLGVTLSEQGIREVVFPVRNTSSHKVELRVAESSCGCSRVIVPKQLEPGQGADIQMFLDVRNREGELAVHSLVEVASAGRTQVIRLEARTFIQPGIFLSPSRLDLQSLPGQKQVQCSVVVRLPRVWPGQAQAAPSGDVPTCTSNYPGVAWTWQSLPPENGHSQFELRLRIDLQVLRERVGRNFGAVHVPDLVVIGIRDLRRSLSLEWRDLLHPVLSGPTAVHAFSLASTGRFAFCLVNHTARPYRISRVECSEPRLKVEFDEVAKVRHEVRLLWSEGEHAPDPAAEHTLRIWLADQAEPFEIPLFLYPKR